MAATTILHRVSTLAEMYRNRRRWDARGVIPDSLSLQRRGEGEWLPTAWDADAMAPGSCELDMEPHLLRVRRGRILARCSDTAVFSASNRMLGFGASVFKLHEHDEYLELGQHPFYRRSIRQRPFPWLSPPEHRPNPVFVLHAPWSHNNYYHFLLDLLPKLSVFLAFPQIDHHSTEVVTTVRMDGYRAEVLNRCREGILSLEPAPWLHLSSPELYVVAMARNHRDNSQLAVRNLRTLFRDEIQGVSGRPRRLWLRRGRQAQRPMLNEKEVTDALLPLGFEEIRPESLTVSEQARIFAEAEVVVAQHGAGLTNVAFCRPGTTVVELYGPRWLSPHFACITRHISGRHVPFRCEESADLSLHVPVPALLNRLEKLGFA
jgi:hypothetical protein